MPSRPWLAVLPDVCLEGTTLVDVLGMAGRAHDRRCRRRRHDPEQTKRGIDLAVVLFLGGVDCLQLAGTNHLQVEVIVE